MAGGAPTTANATPEDKAKSAQAQADATNAALFAQMLGNQKAIYDQRAVPTPMYYQPQQSTQNNASAPMGAPSQYLQIPGFQGVANPFYSAPSQSQAQQNPQARVSSLLNQYNAYKANNANQMYAAKAAQMAQANTAAQAYKDQIAADKAKKAAAEAKAKAEAEAAANQGYANGGIASLYRGY